ncbi:MAG: hypothetical protein ABSG05_01540 [Candidatus Pacearchaeota archaeon]|jgi:hypothetical protein
MKTKTSKNKRAQMKIQQMAFMLIAVTLFFVIAGLFILVINFSGVKQSAKLIDEENALTLVSKIADSPEFSCGNAFDQPLTSCIDTDKVMALENHIQDYRNFWGISGLQIAWVYPNNSTLANTSCTTGNYPACGKITLIPTSNGTGVPNFVNLCRREIDNNSIPYNQCDLGKVIVVYNG